VNSVKGIGKIQKFNSLGVRVRGIGKIQKFNSLGVRVRGWRIKYIMINSFKDLIVWQKAMDLTKEVYWVARKLPPEEMYSLSSQLKRSAISIPSNIAEGHKRGTKDFIRFLIIAYGSSAELETQLMLCNSLYPKINVEKSLTLVTEVEKLLSVIIKKLK